MCAGAENGGLLKCGGSFVCLILEVLRAHLLDNKIDVFCVNNEKPKVEKVQFYSQGGGSEKPSRQQQKL